MPDMNEQPVMPRKVNVFIGISLLFAVLTFTSGVALFVALFDNIHSNTFFVYLCFGPLVCCIAGVVFGLIAKEIAQRYLVISTQGWLAEASVYLNLMSIGLLIVFYVFYLYFLAPLSD
jgi:hypothetical protein